MKLIIHIKNTIIFNNDSMRISLKEKKHNESVSTIFYELLNTNLMAFNNGEFI